MSEINAITCDECGKLFKFDSEEYFTITGNIHVGNRGGIIGNNIIESDEGVIEDVAENHFCHNCLSKLLFKHTNTTTPF